MATSGNYALRVPASLMEDLRAAAEADGVSMNGFIVQAVAEKVAALRARGLLRAMPPEEQAGWLQARAARAQPGAAEAILAKAGRPGPTRPGDEA